MNKKYLLVGDVRLCAQVAYVMQYEPYEIITTLDNIDQYHDYQIVVCAFKKKSKLKIKPTTASIIYLDDLCRTLDYGYNFCKTRDLINPVTKYKQWLKRILGNKTFSFI